MSATFLDIDDPRWMTLIAGDEHASVFHHPAWIRAVADCYGFRPSIVGVSDGAGELRAGLPLLEIRSRLTGQRVVALPFTDFCPPLGGDASAREDLVSALLEARTQKHWPRVEVHWQLPCSNGVYGGAEAYRHVTRLTRDYREVSARFKPNVPRFIRQSEKAGVVVSMGRAWTDVRAFYGLHMQTRRRLGVPVQPLRFFRLLWEQVISRDLGFVLLAAKDDMPIAGGVFLHWNNVLTYKYGASLSEHWQVRPNNLIFSYAIRWGCEHGFREFDWGRTDTDDEGLRNFKRGWGSDECFVRYSVLSDREPSPGAPGWSRRLLVPVVKHSPLWVGRAIGELLYGHFG